MNRHLQQVCFCMLLVGTVACRQSSQDVKQDEKKRLAGVWINQTLLDSACRLGPYFDSTIFWNATQLIIDSNHLNACLLINDDLEQHTYALRYEKNRILLFEPGVADSIIMQYDKKTDCILMHDLMARADFRFVRSPEKKDSARNTDGFKKLIRRCWLNGFYHIEWGNIRNLDNGSGTIVLDDDGHIKGWNLADRYEVFINGDYASFADHPVIVLYKDTVETLYVWEKRNDTIQLYTPITLYDGGEKPYYGKGPVWATLVDIKK